MAGFEVITVDENAEKRIAEILDVDIRELLVSTK